VIDRVTASEAEESAEPADELSGYDVALVHDAQALVEDAERVRELGEPGKHPAGEDELATSLLQR
jgi:hypothetical protein